MCKTKCEFTWGRNGAIEASGMSNIVVIVDTLSFSTTVAYAVNMGATIYPLALGDDPSDLSSKYNAEIAVGRRDVPAKGRFSLSPLTFNNIAENTKVVLPALNGGTCCKLANKNNAIVLIGALVNAEAITKYIMSFIEANRSHFTISIVACGERFKEPNSDGEIRFAIEDYLGAGAIIAGLKMNKTSEALVCEGAFVQNQKSLDRIIWECESGVELRDIGFGDDVKLASQLNSIDVVPALKGDSIERNLMK